MPYKYHALQMHTLNPIVLGKKSVETDYYILYRG